MCATSGDIGVKPAAAVAFITMVGFMIHNARLAVVELYMYICYCVELELSGSVIL